MVYGLSQKKPNLGPSDMVTVHGHCPATGSEMPVASLYPEIVTSRPVQVTGDSSGTQYVFLQKFPLGGGPIELFFHTEVVVCPRAGFSDEDQKTLDGKIAGMTDFAEIDESWWNTRTTGCIELGYGGAMCSQECCGVPHGDSQEEYPLNARRAVISNADVSKKSLYIYGTGS